MPNFNLIQDPWIPVRWLDGRHSLVSLNEVFRESSTIADVDVPASERIAIIRLLVCITQSALGAPANSWGWNKFGANLEKDVITYLGQTEVGSSFNLFGNGKRFLQAQLPLDLKEYPISQLGFSLSSGNTSTLLDHYGESPRNMSPSFLARLLLTYQNFFVGGSMASKVKGNGPSLKMLHAILIGNNLRATILANCLDLDSIGILGEPTWTFVEKKARSRSGYLGQLVPLTCKLRLIEKENGDIKILIDQGVKYLFYPDYRESSSTLIPLKAGGLGLLRAYPSRGIWRDLHCLAVLKNSDNQTQCAPPILHSHLEDYQNRDLHLWVGELVKADDAKIIDQVEDDFIIPPTMFSEVGHSVYERGVQHAENQANTLTDAVKAFAKNFAYDVEKQKGNFPRRNLAQRHFWNTLDQQRQILLDLVKDPASLTPALFADAENPWSKVVWNAAREAYRHTCPDGPTPRLIEAHIAGLKKLRPKTAAAKKTAKTKALPS